MINYYRYHYLLLISVLLVVSCSIEDEPDPIFHKLNPDYTNVTFSNTIRSDETLNAQTDAFLYNGAGVAIGDINNNGLPDLFFSGNMVTSRLYLNKGNMQFEDITGAAGLTTDQRITGASMVDINNNGYLDIYLSVSGAPWSEPEERANLLFLNNGDNTFTEAAFEFGIDDQGFTTHAVFFDYNRNGYLDLFLLGNSPEEFGRGETGRTFAGIRDPNPYGLDQLYRNNGDGTFTNVSEEAGILQQLGYGLGVVVTDLNGNGWPDIYVSNDITPNDVLYINSKDGTFTDKAAEYLRHTSFAGMGIDIADFSNNGWPDIYQTDMMSEHLNDRKRMSGSTTYTGFYQLRQQGFFPHYNVNTLQYNQGVTSDGKIIFSEIGRLAGVSYTDWSWTVLFADFDNDGYKDIFVTNGYPKAVNDFDYLSDMHNARRSEDAEVVKQRELEILESLHGYKISNYLFQNNGDLTFADKTWQWGLFDPGYSYGAAYADLNNNGRLDLVISNINASAKIYENRGRVEDDLSNYLQIKLEGNYPNVRGLGTRLILRNNGKKQYIYHTPYRGYMSTMDDRIHFGLDEVVKVDTLEVIWPDDSYQLLTDIQANQLLTVRQKSVEKTITPILLDLPENHVLNPLREDIGLKYAHQEKSDVDYNTQPLLPYQVSRQGPPLAVGDVTGNGLDDVFIGGATGHPGILYLQQENGHFIESTYMQPWEADRDHDDWGSLFFDANGNGLLDLYVASGGYHLSPASQLLQDRLYLNQGNGRFLKDPQALPEIRTSTAAVTAGDFTGDGRLDLFVGGRMTPRNYPYPPRSYILRNDGNRFTDITIQTASELIEPGGMITDAVWIDFNNSGRLDLVTVGEWMSVEFWQNDGDNLGNVTGTMNLPPLRGWWYSLAKGDFNGNGQEDLIVGNLGLNHSYTTSAENRFGVYAADFSGDRNTDIVFTQEIDGKEYPYYGLAKLGRIIFELSQRFRSFESFSTASVHEVFHSDKLSKALHYQADTFASIRLINNGDGSFTPIELPAMAQISPVKGIVTHDFDGNGNLDLLLAGNLYLSEPNTPRADAGNGLLMNGDGEGNLTPVSTLESGFLAPLDVKNLALIRTPNGHAVLVANNSELLQVFTVNREQRMDNFN
jgi:enediyne biosynthesis protein E4